MKKFELISSERHAVAPANEADTEHYREQMKRMFGNTKLPAINYKGRTYSERVL